MPLEQPDDVREVTESIQSQQAVGSGATITTSTPPVATRISRSRPLYRGTQAVWYVLGVVEVLLVLRFFLKLIGANPAAGFTQFIYAMTVPFAGPFVNVVRSTHVEGAVFEWTTLLAMIVYALAAWGIVKLLVMSKAVSTPEAHVKLEGQDKL